ncbi:melanotransferrin isoform X3 [Pseudopipra pipra]|uniref:melanotransferrin isoform X3 n=1 Tax=Pseudopipra pipra TaxID=415032 RepID=UPI003138EA03
MVSSVLKALMCFIIFSLGVVFAVLGLEHIRWCTVSEQELSKCNDMSKAFGEAGILPTLQCTAGGSAANCTQMIKDDLADAVTLDGHSIYQAGKENGLKPVVGEVYDQEIGTSYYAVAVVKKSSNITINSLKGVRSCHTGINRTAGWDVPVGYLTDSGRLAAMGCDLPKAVSEYFNASCVPGANGVNYPKSLCELCIGNSAGEHKCERNSQEQYYDYSGAFRCLAEGPGEVAFVKHSTVPENTDALPESLNWCVVSTEEIWKCGEMAVAFRKKNLKPEIQCISAKTKEECMEMIQKKESDAVVLGGADIYTAGKTYGLVPAAGESYSANDSSNAYYAVVLVKRNLSNAFTISDLKGKKSCHTGLGRNAGWNIPIGILIKRGIIKPRDCNIPQAVSEFFSASCVPSAEQDNYPSKLCQLCIGDESGNNKCSASSQERYYSYSGAFRCLAEDSGDVAFVKHSTVFENTDGNNTDSWAQNLKSSDFQLLCPNGARAEVTQFADCHLAQVPAQAIMVHPDINVFALYGLLDKAQVYFGNSSNGNGFKMFDSSTFQGKNLIFKDSAVEIVPLQEKRTYTEWLGSEYVESLEGMQTPQCSGAGNKITQYSFVAAVIPLLVLCQIQGLD